MELSETAAILDAILNFSKRSTLQGVHPADSERVHPRLPKSINKNTLHKISGFSPKSGFGCRTIEEDNYNLTANQRIFSYRYISAKLTIYILFYTLE